MVNREQLEQVMFALEDNGECNTCGKECKGLFCSEKCKNAFEGFREEVKKF